MSALGRAVARRAARFCAVHVVSRREPDIGETNGLMTPRLWRLTPWSEAYEGISPDTASVWQRLKHRLPAAYLVCRHKDGADAMYPHRRARVSFIVRGSQWTRPATADAKLNPTGSLSLRRPDAPCRVEVIDGPVWSVEILIGRAKGGVNQCARADSERKR